MPHPFSVLEVESKVFVQARKASVLPLSDNTGLFESSYVGVFTYFLVL